MLQHRYLVLLSAFVCQFMFGGVSNGSPRMLVDLMDTFRASRADTGLILSIMLTFLCFTSLFSSVFLHKFGARATCVLGSLVLAASFCVSFLATSVTFLVVTLGVFGGTGLAFLFVACTPVICDHFQGRSSTHAINFMVSGSSFGGMAFSYIIGYLTEQYGVRGACLLIGGITLNSAAMALLWTPHPNPSNRANLSKREAINMTEHQPVKQHAIFSIKPAKPFFVDTTENQPVNQFSTGSVSINGTEDQSIKIHVPRGIDFMGHAYIKAAEDQPTKQHTPRGIDSTWHGSINDAEDQLVKQHAPNGTDSIGPVSINALENQPIKQYAQSDTNCAGPTSFYETGIQPAKHQASRDIDSVTSVSVNSAKNSPLHQTHTSGSLKSLKDNFRSVFTDKTFLWFSFGNGVQLAVMSNARTYIVDTMLNEDQEIEYGSLTVFLFSLFGIFGRVLFAVIKQLPRSSTLDVNLLPTACGVTGTLLIAFAGSVRMRLVAWCLNGVAMGIYLTALSATTAKLLGKQRVAIGAGLTLLIRGVGSTVGGPLNGYIRDETGTYKAVFICTSVILALGGVFVLVARLNRTRQRKVEPTVQ